MDDIVESVFSKEGTVSQSATGIVRIIILQRYDHVIRSWEAYNNMQDGSGLKDKLKTRCVNSLKALAAMLRPRWKSRKGKDIPSLAGFDEALKADKIDECLDIVMDYLENDLKLTKIDTKQDYDRTNIIKSNKIKEYT